MQWTIIKKKVSLGTRINKQTKANKHGFVLAYRIFFSSSNIFYSHTEKYNRPNTFNFQ